MDPLSDMIALLRPSAAVSKPISGRGRWAVHYDAHDAPGFTIILSGKAWLTFYGEEPLRLTDGDFLLLPTTPAFTLGSEPHIAGTPVTPRTEAVRHGDPDGAPDFMALGGASPSSASTVRSCTRFYPSISIFRHPKAGRRGLDD